MTTLRSYLSVLLVLVCMTAAHHLAVAFDPCADSGGEFRQAFDCASVIQKHNVCCYKRQDGARGVLPKGCCGTKKTWADNDCEGLILDICDTHEADL